MFEGPSLCTFCLSEPDATRRRGDAEKKLSSCTLGMNLCNAVQGVGRWLYRMVYQKEGS